MHIPDGYISPSSSLAAFAAVTPFWMVALRKVRARMRSTMAPRLGLFAAFSFVLMMFNIPLAGGTSGHAVGGALMALVLGPWPAVLGVSAALAIQALVFGDGGIWAFGANALILAVIMPFTAWGAYRVLRRMAVAEAWAAGLAGWMSLMTAALAVALLLGVQPVLFTSPDGAPLYSPFGWHVTFLAMIPGHALVAAPVEGLITALVWGYLRRSHPEMMATANVEPLPGRLRAAWIAAIGLALATPVGLLAQGEAWGEWGGEELHRMLGYVPAGLARIEEARPSAALPDYAVPGLHPAPGYVLAALVGILLVAALTGGLAQIGHARRKPVDKPADAP